MTEAYIQSTFITDQTEFMEHFLNGKQICELLDMPKRPQAQKHIFAGFQTTFWDSGHLKVQKVDYFDYVRNTAMLVLVFCFFKTCFF